MVDRFMGKIMDPEDYAAVLTMFETEGPLSGEELEKLLAVYTKYLDEIGDPFCVKLFLAVDMVAFRGQEDKAGFAPLELGEGTLDTLYRARELTKAYYTMPAAEADGIVARIRDETVPVQARAVLARIALDGMAGAANFAEIREQIQEAAKFLASLDERTLNNCAELVKEMRIKCGR